MPYVSILSTITNKIYNEKIFIYKGVSMNNPSQANATQENANKQEEMLKDYLKNMETCKQQAEEGKKRVENALKAKMLNEAKQHAQSTSNSAYEALNIADLSEKVTIEQDTENTELSKLKEEISKCAKDAHRLAYQTDKLISDEESYKITFDKLLTLLGFLFKLGLLIGGGCIFIYCFFYINYLPSDLAIGNAFSLIFIALGLGIGYVFALIFIALVLGMCYALIVSYPIVFNFLREVVTKILKCLKTVGDKLRKNCGKIIILFILVSCILVSFIAFLIKCFPVLQGFASQLLLYSLLTLSTLLALIIINIGVKNFQGKFLLGKNHSSKDRFTLGVYFVIIQFVIILLFPKLIGVDFLRNSINNLGIARQNVSIELSEKDFNLIKNTAKEADIPVLFSCNENEKTIHGVDVLWHGLGDNTLIEIPFREQNKNIRLELKSSENKIITLGNQTSAKGCIHDRLKNSFDKGKSEPSEKMTNELNDILKKVANNYAVKKLDVTGYADLSPYKGGNQQLSKQRADTVKSKIDEIKKGVQGIENLEVYSIGGGNYHADNKCINPKLSEKDLEDCRMVDRGISLRFHVEQKKPDQGNQQDAQSKQQNN